MKRVSDMGVKIIELGRPYPFLLIQYTFDIFSVGFIIHKGIAVNYISIHLFFLIIDFYF